MKDDDFFTKSRIAIVGLGLIGGSIALKLRGHCETLLAVDPDPASRDIAIQRNIVDKFSSDPADIIPLADAVILAAPVSSILEFIPHLPDLHPGYLIVMDVGSTKTEICSALDSLPSRFETIGGHPMCGKAVGGLNQADAELFLDSPFALTPLPQTSEQARTFAEELVSVLGAVPIWMGPHTHDSWVAATSHLPYLISSALVLSTPLEASHLIGSGFRSASRLASTPSSIMVPIMKTNRRQILDALAQFRLRLEEIEEALEKRDYLSLGDLFDTGAVHKKNLDG
jgi:prephenate dehydrogenase